MRMISFKLFAEDFLKAGVKNFGYLELVGCYADAEFNGLKFEFEHPYANFSLSIRAVRVSDFVLAVEYSVSGGCYERLIESKIAEQINILNSSWLSADPAAGVVNIELSGGKYDLVIKSVSPGPCSEISVCASLSDEMVMGLLNSSRIEFAGDHYRIKIDEFIYDFLGITVSNAVLSVKTEKIIKSSYIKVSKFARWR